MEGSSSTCTTVIGRRLRRVLATITARTAMLATLPRQVPGQRRVLMPYSVGRVVETMDGQGPKSGVVAVSVPARRRSGEVPSRPTTRRSHWSRSKGRTVKTTALFVLAFGPSLQPAPEATTSGMAAKVVSTVVFHGLPAKGISDTQLLVGGSGRHEIGRVVSAPIVFALLRLAKGCGGGAAAQAKGQANCEEVRLAVGITGRGTTTALPVSTTMAAVAALESPESAAIGGGLSGDSMAASRASISCQRSVDGHGRATAAKTKRRVQAMAVGDHVSIGRVPATVLDLRGLEVGHAPFRCGAIVGLPTVVATIVCRLRSVQLATTPNGVRRSVGERHDGGKAREMESVGLRDGRAARAARPIAEAGRGHGVAF